MSTSVLDDRNPSIQYSPNDWNQAGSAAEFDHTTTWTRLPGSTASLTFNGTSIAVFGTIGGASTGVNGVAPVSSYSIDGGAPTMFQAVPASSPQFKQLFFQSQLLTNERHELVIQHVFASGPFFLDYILIAQDAVTPAPVATAVPATITISTTLAMSTLTVNSTDLAATSTQLPVITSSTTTSVPVSASPSPIVVTVTQYTTSITPNPTESASSAPSQTAVLASTGASKTGNAGAIVGGVIAAIAGLLFIIVGVVLWRRRQAKRRSLRFPPSSMWTNQESSAPPPANPFILGTPPPPRRNMVQIDPSPSPPQTYAAEPRYPGGYAPNHPQPFANRPPAPSTYVSSEASYGQPQPGNGAYPSRGYALPSQLMNQPSTDYAQRRTPVATSNPNYAYEAQNGQRTRIQLD